MSARILSSLFVAAAVMLPIAPSARGQESGKYTTDKEAFAVGAAFYNSRNFKASREPFEAALKLTKDDELQSISTEHLAGPMDWV